MAVPLAHAQWVKHHPSRVSHIHWSWLSLDPVPERRLVSSKILMLKQGGSEADN